MHGGLPIRKSAALRACRRRASLDSLVTNGGVLRRHVLNHPSQMRDVVLIDQRVDEVAGETLVAAATRGRANWTGVYIRFDRCDRPCRCGTRGIKTFGPHHRPGGVCGRSGIDVVRRIIVNHADMSGTAGRDPCESCGAVSRAGNRPQFAPGDPFIARVCENNRESADSVGLFCCDPKFAIFSESGAGQRNWNRQSRRPNGRNYRAGGVW